MSRPYTDITTSTNNNIKNGSSVVSCTFRGKYNTSNIYVQNYPVIASIQQKYGNRFYNGIFVQVLNGQIAIV